MSLSVGIVGLPNVGKSTLFNALLKKQQAYAANFPFATIEPNVGVVPVPDERLSKLAETVALSSPGLKDPKTGALTKPPMVPASVTFVDIAGLIAGAHKGEGLGNKFLSHIREADVVLHVVRAFKDEDIVREGSIDPKSDFEIVKTELELADLEHPDAPALSRKPILVALNVSEKDLKNADKLEEKYSGVLGISKDQTVAISARLEEQLAELSDEDKIAYLKDLGMERTGLERLIKKAFSSLGLITFLTAGEKEVRAWTLRRGETALKASSVIHTDFAKNFIKADAVDFEDFVALGGWKNAREKGRVRSEGRDYVVKDSDVVEFKIGA